MVLRTVATFHTGSAVNFASTQKEKGEGKQAQATAGTRRPDGAQRMRGSKNPTRHTHRVGGAYNLGRDPVGTQKNPCLLEMNTYGSWFDRPSLLREEGEDNDECGNGSMAHTWPVSNQGGREEITGKEHKG